MAKIMFVGDTHFQSESPSSRKEDPEHYRQTQLDKLENIKQICLQEEIHHLIILGDVFNSSINIYTPYLTKLYEVFRDFKNNGIILYSIIGNHDMYYQNDSEFDKTLLYQAFALGLIEHLDTLEVGPVTIIGVDFLKDFPKASNSTGYKVLVGHCFYENERFGGAGNGNLTKEKCKDLGYNVYILGHDHTPYETIKELTYEVIRPGSLMRGTSKTCNLYRKVNVEILDTNTFTWEEREIPCKPGTEVFIEKAVLSKSKDLDLNLEDLLENFTASKGVDIYNIIDEREETAKEILKDKYDEVIKVINMYLESRGVFRTNTEV